MNRVHNLSSKASILGEFPGVPLGTEAVVDDAEGGAYDMELQDHAMLGVPKVPSSILVTGSVRAPTVITWQKGKRTGGGTGDPPAAPQTGRLDGLCARTKLVLGLRGS